MLNVGNCNGKLTLVIFLKLDHEKDLVWSNSLVVVRKVFRQARRGSDPGGKKSPFM